MSELVATAERLRVVKDACLDFMTLWALDQLMEKSQSIERLCGDLLANCEFHQDSRFSTLYSGRRMDD